MRNIRLAYFLSFFAHSWFWLGIWLLYYLRFTNYAGVGLLEMFMIVTRVATEIPTGAIADLFGRKKALLGSFFFYAIGNLMLGLAGNFPLLFVSVLLIVFGSSLYSGTLDALVFDTLQQNKKDHLYAKVTANISTIESITFACSSVIGGFLYLFFPGFPFVLTGISGIFGLGLCFFLIEPQFVANPFSFSLFIRQNVEGFHQLWKSSRIKKESLYLIFSGLFLIILYEMGNDASAVELGLSPQGLGIIIAALFAASAIASQFTPYFLKKFTVITNITLMSIILAVLLIAGVKVGLVLGMVFLVARAVPHRILNNITSVVVNQNTDSQHRATTLSTINMLESLPYACTAYFIGAFMDKITARNFAALLGVLLIGVVVVSHLTFLRDEK